MYTYTILINGREYCHGVSAQDAVALMNTIAQDGDAITETSAVLEQSTVRCQTPFDPRETRDNGYTRTDPHLEHSLCDELRLDRGIPARSATQTPRQDARSGDSPKVSLADRERSRVRGHRDIYL
mgnify:CR=1 FL=1